MAFLGHIDCQGAMVSRELFCGTAANNQDDIETIEGSRTYIKTYDQESPVQAMGSRSSTVRYVGGSESSSENTLDETESSILRRCLLESQRTLLAEHEELDTGSETICLGLGSPESTSSCSLSSSSCESDGKEKSSTTSMCSWEEAVSRGESMLQPSSQVETGDFSMPSLHLGSDRGSGALTYTRRLHPHRLERPADEAYENWLLAKRQQAKYRRQAEQKSREEQMQREELRHRLSQERYEQWCRQKAKQSLPASPKNVKESARIPPRKPHNAASTSSRLQQWELEKLRLAEQRCLQLRSAERRRQQENLQRKKQADHAFKRWMSHVDHRPKPVPSCQGIKSLRGTISALYINPNPWVN